MDGDEPNERLREMLRRAEEVAASLPQTTPPAGKPLDTGILPAPVRAKVKIRVCESCGEEFRDEWTTRPHKHCRACDKPKVAASEEIPPVFDRRTEKQCLRCYRVKPLEEFYPRGSHQQGHHSWCKECLQRYSRRANRVHYKQGREVTVESKVCVDCGERKPAEDFTRHGGSKDGLHSKCKPCRKKYLDERESATPDAE